MNYKKVHILLYCKRDIKNIKVTKWVTYVKNINKFELTTTEELKGSCLKLLKIQIRANKLFSLKEDPL